MAYTPGTKILKTGSFTLSRLANTRFGCRFTARCYLKMSVFVLF
jgi:hypothetical protein